MAVAMGLAGNVLRESDDKVNHWLRMVTDLATPQLIGRPGKPEARAQLLARQRKAAARAK